MRCIWIICRLQFLRVVDLEVHLAIDKLPHSEHLLQYDIDRRCVKCIVDKRHEFIEMRELDADAGGNGRRIYKDIAKSESFVKVCNCVGRCRSNIGGCRIGCRIGGRIGGSRKIIVFTVHDNLDLVGQRVADEFRQLFHVAFGRTRNDNLFVIGELFDDIFSHVFHEHGCCFAFFVCVDIALPICFPDVFILDVIWCDGFFIGDMFDKIV